MTDLLNEFWRETEREKHLRCYTSLVRRARPYTFDDDAVDLITEIASGDKIAEKLAVFRRLSRLPFEEVWFELDYKARHAALVRLGTLPPALPKDAPLRMGWLLQRLSDTSWRAINVCRFAPESTGSGRKVDTFGVAHVVSTEGRMTDFRSLPRDPSIRQAVAEMNVADQFFNDGRDGVSIIQAIAWGFGENDHANNRMVISLPRHLAGSNAVDLPLSWEPVIERTSKGIPSQKIANTKKFMMESAREIQGDLRFLCAALAMLNNVPMEYHDVQPRGSAMIGGRMRPYMVNRVVRVGIPKKRGRVGKVMAMLKLAEREMRRHEVGGYFKRVRYGKDRAEVKEVWISNYWRGNAQLGYVNQERVVEKN